MKRADIEKIIKEIAVETIGAELSLKETLKESGVDSLSLVTLIVSIEERLEIAFLDDDLQPENIQTLNDLISLTEKYA